LYLSALISVIYRGPTPIEEVCMNRTYENVVEFHGHSCPGLALGFRTAIAAMKWLNANRSEDEEIVAVVENDSCAVDAIQVITGCTFGKGNLLFRDIGKRGYTFCNRRTGKGIRIVERYAPLDSPRHQELRKAVFSATATEQQRQEWQDLRQHTIDDILRAPESSVLSIAETNAAPPPQARVFDSLICSRCGEKVMETRAVKTDAGVYCADCAKRPDN
jgi:formylmethanofuran dehydrogenase subunit E